MSKEVEDIINYIENDSEIAIPIDRLFNQDGTHITKKEYGLIVIDILSKELRSKFCNETFKNDKND